MRNKIKILFLGELISSHAQSWMNLLENDDRFIASGADLTAYSWNREALGIPLYFQPQPTWPFRICRRICHEKVTNALFPDQIIKGIEQFKPDIIHTFGLFPSSSFFFKIKTKIAPTVPWVVQARGGPDLAFNRKDIRKRETITRIFQECQLFIADNQQNYSYALELGLNPQNSAQISMPGTGGILLSQYTNTPLPSQKNRVIFWPKAYTNVQSYGAPVVEALKRAMPHIMPCRVIATAATPDIVHWFTTMLAPYKDHIEIHERLPRSAILDYYKKSRVLLAPSLVDGIPNVLYEAMASNTVPIVSPIETLTPLFEHERNVLFAQNLEPQEIANALIAAMNEDVLVDAMAKTNLGYVKQLACRTTVKHKVKELYTSLLT